MRNNMFQKYCLLKCNAVGTGWNAMKLEPKDCGNRKVFLEDLHSRPSIAAKWTWLHDASLCYELYLKRSISST
jgi:hypothetical protein